MDIAEELLSKIPLDIQRNDHFRAFTETVALQQISDTSGILHFLDREIADVSQWLKTCNSTDVREVKQMTMHIGRLEKYKLWKNWCEAYL